jgi:predicted PurR-regulated permease PerM
LFITFSFKGSINFHYWFKKLIPDSHEDQILSSLEKIHLLSRYFIGLLSIIYCFFFILNCIILFVPNAIVIAFMRSTNIIPYIGPLIASILAAILTMMSTLGRILEPKPYQQRYMF